MSKGGGGAPAPSYAIERLNESHVVEEFDCGEEVMNAYLKEHARNNADLNFRVTHILLRIGSPRVLGYYTLTSASMIPKEVFSSKKRWGLPRYDIPVIRL